MPSVRESETELLPELSAQQARTGVHGLGLCPVHSIPSSFYVTMSKQVLRCHVSALALAQQRHLSLLSSLKHLSMNTVPVAMLILLLPSAMTQLSMSTLSCAV